MAFYDRLDGIDLAIKGRWGDWPAIGLDRAYGCMLEQWKGLLEGLYQQRRGIMSAKVIAIANQKGGVGKTTSAVNLSVALHLLGYRVLVIDMDYQANCSSSFNL